MAGGRRSHARTRLMLTALLLLLISESTGESQSRFKRKARRVECEAVTRSKRVARRLVCDGIVRRRSSLGHELDLSPLFFIL